MLLPFATDLQNWAQIAPYIRNYQHQDYQFPNLFISWMIAVLPLLSNQHLYIRVYCDTRYIWMWLTTEYILSVAKPAMGRTYQIIKFIVFLKTLKNLISTFFFSFCSWNHHQSVLPKCRSFTASAGTKAAVPKAGLPPQIQEPRLQFYQKWIGEVASRCFQHPTLSLFLSPSF